MNAILGVILVLQGWGYYYAPGVFDGVWDYREHHMPICGHCTGRVAMMGAEHLGNTVYVVLGDAWLGPLYVIDAAANPRKRQANQDLIELDDPERRLLHMRGPRWLKVIEIKWGLSAREEGDILQSVVKATEGPMEVYEAVFAEGGRAYCQGLRQDQNPYQRATIESIAWRLGWRVAEEEGRARERGGIEESGLAEPVGPSYEAEC